MFSERLPAAPPITLAPPGPGCLISKAGVKLCWPVPALPIGHVGVWVPPGQSGEEPMDMQDMGQHTSGAQALPHNADTQQ